MGDGWTIVTNLFEHSEAKGSNRIYYDIETREEYWISGCRKDGRDALYNTEVEVDEDALDEYWIKIRKRPRDKNLRHFRSQGKY